MRLRPTASHRLRKTTCADPAKTCASRHDVRARRAARLDEHGARRLTEVALGERPQLLRLVLRSRSERVGEDHHDGLSGPAAGREAVQCSAAHPFPWVSGHGPTAPQRRRSSSVETIEVHHKDKRSKGGEAEPRRQRSHNIEGRRGVQPQGKRQSLRHNTAASR